ncbi:MAG: hypothetical protein GTO45_14890 [Candidatus Aminicenantes bacterium]|nr:hypothetical protein [Candidatus Aminicenantes bacterium]NIM80050.1 hypothetical protein [Candidatus Aminicenantes bacterium]NIN19393.1 hypothetical protein [Candidatus Aminicenantes bacterium]NIN43292.1 hypothetical protein [Candidatus Aminicenantes bacterium]NIN86036.1 hypothetical protein [Candidatus Aminicenantes bacterium]
MVGKIVTITSLILIFLWSFSGCSGLRYKYDVTPDAEKVYHSLRIKVNVKYKGSGERDNFKIILKFDNTRDKMLFLSPLNQVYGLLVVNPNRENALLVNTKKKKYWTGPFHILLQELWGPGMDFNYKEFKQLIVEGVKPGDKLKRRDINISIEKTDNSEEEKPGRMTITTRDVRVKIKISHRTTGKGRIRFSVDLAHMKKAGLREILE